MFVLEREFRGLNFHPSRESIRLEGDIRYGAAFVSVFVGGNEDYEAESVVERRRRR